MCYFGQCFSIIFSISRQHIAEVSMGSAPYFFDLNYFNFAMSIYSYGDLFGTKGLKKREIHVQESRATVLNEVENINTDCFGSKLVMRDGYDGYQVYLETTIDLENHEDLTKIAESMQSCYNYSGGDCYYYNFEGYRKYFKPNVELHIALNKGLLDGLILKQSIEKEIEAVTRKFTSFAKKQRMGIVGSWGVVEYSWLTKKKPITT